MTTKQPFGPAFGSNQILTAGASSLSATVHRSNNQVRVLNTGANIAYLKAYSSLDGTLSATTADYPIAAGTSGVFTKSLFHDRIAYISATGTTLQLMTGEGF